MNEAEARRILGDTVQPDDSLFCLGHYTCWRPDDTEIVLDDRFSVEELEAMVWWMRNKSVA